MPLNSDHPRVAVVLAGCGFKDGSEIREAVLALTALSIEGAKVKIFAPDIELEEVNHLTGKKTGSRRSLLAEAARIARGQIESLDQAQANDFDALVLPGGFGVATNLCTFAQDGADCHVQPGLEKFIDQFILARKPIGAICIAPALLARVLKKHGGAKLTIGSDTQVAALLKQMGSQNQITQTDDIAIDADRKIVTTPAYMDDTAELSKIWAGISKCISQVVRFAR